MKHLRIAGISAALIATTALAGAAHAQMVTALVGQKTLVTFDTKTGKKAGSIAISGMPAAVVGIDVRPADGLLYALAKDGTVATIDVASGKATIKTKLDKAVPEGPVTVDFNPVADRLRVMGADGTNLRANVDDGKTVIDGKLVFKEGDSHAGKMPKVVAGAYTNSFKGTKEAALYDIEISGAFLKQAPPNDGILNSTGTIGMKGENVAFDIYSDGTSSKGFLAQGNVLYAVDLANGATSKLSQLQGFDGKDLTDIAIWSR